MDSPRGLSNPSEKHDPASVNPPKSEKKTSPKSSPPPPPSYDDTWHPNLWFLNAGTKNITEVRGILQTILHETRLSEDCLGPIRLIPIHGSRQNLYRVVMLPELANAIIRSPLGTASFLKRTPSYYLPLPAQMQCRQEDYSHTLSVFRIPSNADSARIKYMMECEIDALRRFGFVAPKRVTNLSTDTNFIELHFAYGDSSEPVEARAVAWSRLVLHGLDPRPYMEAKDISTLRVHHSNEMNPQCLLPCRWKRCYIPNAPPPTTQVPIQWIYPPPDHCPNCGFHFTPRWTYSPQTKNWVQLLNQ